MSDVIATGRKYRFATKGKLVCNQFWFAIGLQLLVCKIGLQPILVCKKISNWFATDLQPKVQTHFVANCLSE